MIDDGVRQAQALSEAERRADGAIKAERHARTTSHILAVVVAILLITCVVVGVWAYYSTRPSGASNNPTGPSPNPSPSPGTYWFNKSFSGTASQVNGGCVATPNECTPYWFDFNVTCPTGNMVLNGTWSNAAGFPTMLRISSDGAILATSGGDVPWYGTTNASSGSFHVIAHETVSFRMLSAWDMSQEISIDGTQDSWSVIL